MNRSRTLNAGGWRREILVNLIRRQPERREPLPTFRSLSETVRNMYEEVSHTCALCRSESPSDSRPQSSPD
jgi:hypothetical protein